MKSKKVKQNDEDQELLNLTKILSDIHKEYFSLPDNDVINILKNKKKIFTGLCFYSLNPLLKKRIEDYDGHVTNEIEEASYILVHKNEELDLSIFKARGSVLVDECYVFDCVYNLKKLNVEKYVLYDFSEDDQLLNEINEMF